MIEIVLIVDQDRNRIIVYVGTAIFDNLDLIGTVSFPAPNSLTDGCAMTLDVFGFEES